jgi:hypothetical protein
MKIVVIDYELPDYICTDILDGRTFEPLDEKQFKEWLSYEDSEIYFVNVKDKTWNKFKTKNSKRLELTLDELMKLIKESSELILIKGNRAKSCTYYPEDEDPIYYKRTS